MVGVFNAFLKNKCSEWPENREYRVVWAADHVSGLRFALRRRGDRADGHQCRLGGKTGSKWPKTHHIGQARPTEEGERRSVSAKPSFRVLGGIAGFRILKPMTACS